MDNDEVIGAIREAVTVRPGDTLILRLDPDMSPDEFESFCVVIREQIPEGIRPLVIGGRIEQIACIRGDAR